MVWGALLLAGAAGAAEHPAVEAASANLWVKRPPPRAESPDLTLTDRRGRTRTAGNIRAGVPGTVITVEFPPDSAVLDDAQRLALHMLTRELRSDPAVKLLWVQAGTDTPPFETGGDALAEKRADVLRRAMVGKGFPWKKVFIETAATPCGGDECRRASRQGRITVIGAR